MSRRIDKDEAAHLQYETEHTEPPKSRSVIVYMVILVAAAFCSCCLPTLCSYAPLIRWRASISQ